MTARGSVVSTTQLASAATHASAHHERGDATIESRARGNDLGVGGGLRLLLGAHVVDRSFLDHLDVLLGHIMRQKAARLVLPQKRVVTAAAQQIVVRALLDDTPLLED